MIYTLSKAHRVVAAAVCVTLSSAAWCDTPREGTRYFFHDHLGNVVAVSNRSGDIDLRIASGPFGAPHWLAGGAGASNVARFTGKSMDTTTGLYYFDARHYDPRSGRFLSPDPARQTRSPYAYAGGAPLSNVDPDGRMYLFLRMLNDATRIRPMSTVGERLTEVRALRRAMEYELVRFDNGDYPLSNVLGAEGAKFYNDVSVKMSLYRDAKSSRSWHTYKWMLAELEKHLGDLQRLRLTHLPTHAVYEARYRVVLTTLGRYEQEISGRRSSYLEARARLRQWKRNATHELRTRYRATREYRRQLVSSLPAAREYEAALEQMLPPGTHRSDASSIELSDSSSSYASESDSDAEIVEIQ